MASLWKIVSLFMVILAAVDAQTVASYFAPYVSPSAKAPSPPAYPTPTSYPPSPVYPPSSYPPPQYPPAYPPTSYPSNPYNPVYNPPSTIYNPPVNVYNQPATIYNPPANVYNPPANVYNPPANVYNQPANVYNPPATVYNPPTTGYNPPAQNPYNYVYPQVQGPYTVPLVPQYPVPYMGYPSTAYNYNGNCTDTSCKPTECCEFNGKRFVCVEQNTDLLQSDITGFGVYCARAKRCYSNGDCPANHCCVIRLDIPYDSSQYGSYGASNMYGSYGSYGAPNYKTERGECLLYAPVDGTCRKPVDNAYTSSCPCVTGTTCTFSVINPLTGICQKPAGKPVSIAV